MSGAPVEIPLIASAQSFTVTLVGIDYNMTVRWNVPANCWMLDIADSSDEPLVQGIAMVTGGDLLAPYAYLGIGGQLIVQTDDDTNAVPTYDNLGTTSHLYFIPND